MDALEGRFRALEARLNAPNEFTHARLVQALEEKYGEASEELIRLQKTVELVNRSKALLSSSQETIDHAQSLSPLQEISPDVEIKVSQLGLVVLYGTRKDTLAFTRNGNTEEIRNASEYDNVVTTTIHLALPEESFVWRKSKSQFTVQSTHCYFLSLK